MTIITATGFAGPNNFSTDPRHGPLIGLMLAAISGLITGVVFGVAIGAAF